MMNWLLLLSTAFQTVWVILNVHLPRLPLVEVDKGPWLPYIPVSFLPQVGTGAAQEVYSFYEIIPQLEKHTLSKKKSGLQRWYGTPTGLQSESWVCFGGERLPV